MNVVTASTACSAPMASVRRADSTAPRGVDAITPVQPWRAAGYLERVMRRSIGWIVGVAVAAAVGRAEAQPDGLAGNAAGPCGWVDALRARIEVHLGRPLAAADAIRAEVGVVRAPIGGDVRASLRIATRRGRAAREVHGANCAAVVDAVAFVLA